MNQRILFQKTKILFWCSAVSLFSSIYCGAALAISKRSEPVEVSGEVTNEEGEGLPGVTIAIKGTTIGTVTNSEGFFSIAANAGQTLIFSSIGYKTKEIVYGGQGEINVTLSASATELNEIVAVGYQTQRKVDLTGAVSVVKLDDIKNSPTSNPIKSLQGLVPGLYITTNGDPSGSASVRVRGVRTLNNNDPLYIIDGVPTESSAFQSLNPADIASIQVLKDASSAAIYGARASNGVFIVTTKKGTKKTSFSFSSQVTQTSFATVPEVLTARERARVQWQATINDGLDPDDIDFVTYKWHKNTNGTAILDGIEIPEYLADGVPSANTNWFDAITRPGFVQNYNLSMSTGSDRGGAFLSLGYLKNQYIEKYKDYSKLSARINSHYTFFNDRVTIGENFTISNGINNGDFGTDAFNFSLQIRPVLPVKTEDGNYSGPITGDFVDHPNPLMILDLNKWDQVNNLNLFGNVYARVNILDNLFFNTTLGLEHSTTKIRDIQRTFSTGFINNTVNSLRNTNQYSFNWDFNTTLQYDLAVKRNNISFLVGTEAIKDNYSDNSAYREDFALETLDYFVLNAASGSQIVTGSASGFALLSYFGKVNFSNNDKYLASATLRYDGSSRFGKNNHFGLFPAFSAGWRIGEESFIKDNAGFISQLKLRGGWGVTGNQKISNTARFGLFQPHYANAEIAFNPDDGTAYDLAGADSGPLPSGFRKIQSGNDNLKWETTVQTNIGLDFGVFKQKLSGSFDYFITSTKDILISPAYLAAQGEGGNRYVNGASVETKGYEVALNYRNRIGEFNYNINGNIGHYKDKITDLPENVVHSYPGNLEKTILGRSMNSIFGYVAEGIFKTEDAVKNSAEQPGKGVGRIKYADLNNDGVINTLDQKYIGVGAPSYSYGLDLQGSYKRFSVRIFFQGIGGISVYDSRKRFSDFTDLWAGTNYGKRTLQAWSPSNPNSSIPAVTLSDNNNEGRQSTYFVSNGSYLKLRQVSVGYRMDDVLHLSNIKLYLTGENLLTVKDTKGANAFVSPDPENPGYGFPRPRKITFGIDVAF